ncbi:MAG: hypothetical protein FWF79_08615 [Defluviitaleaceae bacterium]|nr:hypothetical protein [Defluviitaleaceae bacterium]
MISLFGAMSLIILIASVAALILHFKVMKFRGAVDDSLEKTDSLLRDRIEIIYNLAREAEENLDNPLAMRQIIKMCETHASYDTQKLIKTRTELEESASELLAASNCEINKKALSDNTEEIRLADIGLQNVAAEYNKYISATPGNIMALMLGLSVEDFVSHSVSRHFPDR